MDLPQTLHGQLYLLAFDRKRGTDSRATTSKLLGSALRAAMLTDLYLTGHLEDKQGQPYASRVERLGDPLLARGVRTERLQRKGLGRVDHRKPRRNPRLVRDQIEADGWIQIKHSRMLGIIPTTSLRLYEEDLVGALADRVTDALRNAVGDRPADPRPLAVGLLAVLAQMPMLSAS